MNISRKAKENNLR